MSTHYSTYNEKTMFTLFIFFSWFYHVAFTCLILNWETRNVLRINLSSYSFRCTRHVGFKSSFEEIVWQVMVKLLLEDLPSKKITYRSLVNTYKKYNTYYIIIDLRRTLKVFRGWFILWHSVDNYTWTYSLI